MKDKTTLFDGMVFLGDLPPERKPNFAIFLSGSGSNAEKLLEDSSVRAAAVPVVLVTDSPERSRAREIAAKHDLPLVECDIRQFYRDHGLDTISLATPEGQTVRELWTERLRELLQPYQIDFGVLAGFEPLTNITGDFPCLNVHPGDLTKTDEKGVRKFVGLHTRPVEAAILAGETSLRSSVILAQTITGAGGEMDNGLLMGISQEMPIEFDGLTLERLKSVKAARTGRKPAGGWKDELEELAKKSQNQLKYAGDHHIFPLVVRDFARQCFAVKGGKLYFRPDAAQDFSTDWAGEYDEKGLRLRCQQGL